MRKYRQADGKGVTGDVSSQRPSKIQMKRGDSKRAALVFSQHRTASEEAQCRQIGGMRALRHFGLREKRMGTWNGTAFLRLFTTKKLFNNHTMLLALRKRPITRQLELFHHLLSDFNSVHVRKHIARFHLLYHLAMKLTPVPLPLCVF